jgi:hypothetical protein
VRVNNDRAGTVDVSDYWQNIRYWRPNRFQGRPAIKPVIGDRLYHFGKAAIRGVLPDAVLCDKISVLSSERIFRRAKDVLDVYALAHCLEVRTVNIYTAIEKAERALGSFELFLARRADLEHAYQKMRGIMGKPDFDSVYLYLGKFLEPFITQDRAPKVWHNRNAVWDNEMVRIRPKKKPDRDSR